MEFFMKILYIIILLILIQIDSVLSQSNPDEIVFYSNTTNFSPMIITEGEATILWTFDDGTTSSLAKPVKYYPNDQLRINRLKVTPWSAVTGINIGYDASDGGSPGIPFVSSVKASKVENLELVAPYLKLWCSSYNLLDTLFFDNFVKLETIECYLSPSLKKISLYNTPSLKRLNVEDNDLKSLDLSDCISLEDLRGSLNDFIDILFPVTATTLKSWHICVRDNPQLLNPNLFTDLSKFKCISELLIWNSNQSGKLEIHNTFEDSIYINASGNKYTVVDFSGAFQNENGWAKINLNGNLINSLNIEGCDQIKHLNLNTNKLPADSVDLILQQLDNFGTLNGYVDLRGNQIPTSVGFSHLANLESKGWVIYTENYSKIKVLGNGNEILDGANLPITINWTDFDSVGVDGDSIVHTFTIKNEGTTDLRLLGTNHLLDQTNPWIPPYIGISGTNATDFKVISEPSGTIAPGESTEFQISFNPSGLGTRTAKVYFPNSDWSKAPFDFMIQGEGVLVTTIVEENSDQNNIPDKFELSQNYPNPFNPSTSILYSIPFITQGSSSRASTSAHHQRGGESRDEGSLVQLKVYDILGNEIITLVDEYKSAGFYQVNFNANDLPSGLYFYRLQAGDFFETKKMLLLK
jgi:hypothetical protein